MSTFDMISFPDQEQLAQAAAAEWLAELATHGTGPFYVALSGGRVASKLFDSIRDRLDPANKMILNEPPAAIKDSHFFWADERCVPPDDPESNFAVAHKLLFSPLAIPEAQVHRIHGEDPPELAAANAEAELCRAAAVNFEGEPILDLIFLGMGEDGHVASLFPGEPESVMKNMARYRPVTAVKPPPKRVTMGYPVIAAAKQVWVLASGAGKEKALQESLQCDGKTPLARVLNLRSHTRIFTDIRV